MLARDYRDIVGGAALILFGGFAALHAIFFMRMGTFSQMGPGMFPAGVGCIIALLGAAILLPALFRRGVAADIDLRSGAAVIAGMLAFATMVAPFGIVPAVLALTLIASRADSKLSPLGTLVVAATLSAGAALIFRVGLGVPVAIVAWPW